MASRFISASIVAMALVFLAVPNSSAVEKVARAMNFVDFYIGSSMPTGERDGLPDYEFLINNRTVQVNSSDIYKNTFHMGVSLGQLRMNHFLWSLGLHYTDNRAKDLIYLTPDTALQLLYNPTYRQLDFAVNFNFYLMDLMKTSFSPYAGLGVRGGIMMIDDEVNTTDYSANLGLNANFGADLKIWSSTDARSFVTLSSVNSYDFYGSSDRPKYLNIGGAIKYYFRP